MSFSEAQERAIAHKDGPVMVLAGPGSGKTLVITQRTKYLIDTYHINPRQILVITFTKAAAQEMQARFQTICKSGGVTFGTFHAVFFSILKHAYHFTSANVMSEDVKMKMLRGIFARCNARAAAQGAQGDSSGQAAMDADTLSELAAEISLVKNERISLENYYSRSCPEEIFRDVYRTYEETHRAQRLLDFDDMLTYTWELLTQRPDILHAWQERWPYILVDEFQDINLLQYEILRLLAAPRDNLFIVGDDDQSIYRFRGAKPEIMLNFPKDYPKAETILLDKNFRSAKTVVDGATQVIEENKHRFTKKICNVRPAGTPIELKEFQNQEHECLYLVQQVKKRVEEEGASYRDIAILVRTNQGAGPVAERLMEFNIPFVMRETLPSVFEHWIAKDIFAYLHLAYENLDRTEFLQIMNRPKRYISREAVSAASRRTGADSAYYKQAGTEPFTGGQSGDWKWSGNGEKVLPDLHMGGQKGAGSSGNSYQSQTAGEGVAVSFAALKAFYQDKDWMTDRLIRLEADLKLLPKLAPYAAINYIRYGMQYEEYLRDYAASRRMKPEELLDILEEIQQGAKPYHTVEEWYRHIAEYNATLEENRKKAKKSEEDAITIATLHASKGLEFPEVYLLDVNEGVIPHHRAALEEDFEEERRLFYVGMTRAKDRLHIFYVKERFGKAVAPSGFLDVFLD